jgi:hypothetical protein
MKTIKMLFVKEPVAIVPTIELRRYSYDTKEELKVGEVYSSPSYPKNFLQVDSIEPKDDNLALPYKIKELVIGEPPAIAVSNTNLVYLKKVN